MTWDSSSTLTASLTTYCALNSQLSKNPGQVLKWKNKITLLTYISKQLEWSDVTKKNSLWKASVSLLAIFKKAGNFKVLAKMQQSVECIREKRDYNLFVLGWEILKKYLWYYEYECTCHQVGYKVVMRTLWRSSFFNDYFG